MPSSRYTGPPMTLANMRAQGVRSIKAYCNVCHYAAVLSADQWPDDLPMTWFDPKMVCTSCGIVGADVRPNCKEQTFSESLTGRQWY